MSQENVEVVRAAMDAFNRRDLAALTQRFDPEIEWAPGGPAAVEHAVYRGRDEVSSGFVVIWEAWARFRMRESELRDLEDSIVWLGHAHLKGGTSHVALDREFAVHFLVRDRKIVRIRGFLGWQEALEAAGLAE